MKKAKFLTITIATVLLLFSCDGDDAPITPDDDINDDTTEKAVSITNDINSDMLLENHSEGTDYIIEDDISIKGIVRVEPGTKIVFKASTSLYIDEGGALSAIGTEEDPIIFCGEEPIKGFWKGIGFESSDVRNELNHVTIEDAGSDLIDNTWYKNKTAVVVFKTVNKGKLTLKNSKIQNTDGFGLVVMNSTTLQSFENNVFENNTNDAVRLPINMATEIDKNTTFSNNGFNGISIRESDLSTSEACTLVAKNYYVDGEIDIRGTLDINAGVKLNFSPAGFIRVEGDNAYLNAVGTSDNNIVFTGEVTSAPSWKGLLFHNTNNVNNLLSYCEVSYGGSDDHTFVSNKANITLFHGSNVTVNNSIISNSGGCGIIEGSKTGTGWGLCILTESDNIYNDNASSNICDHGL